MSQLFQPRPGPLYRQEKPVRSPEYRRFIKRLPCLGCLKAWGIDPAHTGPHAYGRKACDLKCIPLCRKCHDQFDADPYGFAARHKLDIPETVKFLNARYQRIFHKEAA